MEVEGMSVGVEIHGRVGVVELRRPPHNFLTPAFAEEIAQALEALEADPNIRAAVLAADGRSFCAGMEFHGGDEGGQITRSLTDRLYAAAVRLCAVDVPIVAAVHGPAIGGGLGLALTASIRVTCPEARLSANFAKLGIHHGFGLSVTLPAQIGPSRAALVLLTGRRFSGDEALAIGLADLCVPADQVRSAALELASEISENAPLALGSIQRTLRRGLADRVREATKHEAAEQLWLGATEDAREGLQAALERRTGQFTGR